MSTSPSQGSPFFFSLFRKWIQRERNSLRSLLRPPFFSFFFYIVSDIFHVVFVFLIIFFFYTFFVMNFYTDTRNYNWFHSRYTRGEYLRAKRKKKSRILPSRDPIANYFFAYRFSFDLPSKEVALLVPDRSPRSRHSERRKEPGQQ